MNWNGTPPAQQGPREVYAPDLAQRMDKLLTLYEKNLPKPNRLETVSYTASPVPFDTQNYRHSYLVLDTTVTLSVELTGKTYTLQLSEGVNRVDFAQGACVSCSAGCQAILIRSDDHYLSSGDVLLGPGGQPIGTSSYPMYVSVTGSNTNFSEETTASTAETTYTANVTQWFTFANDDATENIQINFDATVGSAGTMTIKPGEVLNGMPRKFTTLHVKAAAGTPAFRAWGV